MGLIEYDARLTVAQPGQGAACNTEYVDKIECRACGNGQEDICRHRDTPTR